MKKRYLAIILILSLLALSGCSRNRVSTAAPTAAPASSAAAPSSTAAVKTAVSCTVTKDEKFGAATMSLSEAEMESAGFHLGDSVDLLFANGYSLTDVPYYNGYYVKNGAPVMVAYPGFANVSITLNNMGIWDQAKLSAGEAVTVTLKEAGRFAAIQDSLGQSYSFDRNEYETDESFVNFRALSGGKLKEDYLFRGASPVDNSRSRAPYADALLKANSVGFIMDLADSAEDIAKYEAAEGFSSAYTADLIKNGHAALLAMGSSYQSEKYQQQVAAGFRGMLAGKDCPAYIHCMEGKDRTGFVCMLTEALAGASYDEMLADYMITYWNYYKVSKSSTPEKYNAIAELYFNSFVEYLHGTADVNVLKTADYSEDAKAYLKAGGMTEAEIDALIKRITK